MTVDTRQGVALAIGLLEREILVGAQSERDEQRCKAAIAWLEHQLEVDARRRRPRGKYRHG